MLRVVKLRGSPFAAGQHSFLISDHGLDVAYTSVVKVMTKQSFRRLSTGIERLDRMIDGGLREGTVALISGLPGTAKTTIGASVLLAALEAGERALLVGFDEPANQMIADLESVGIRLEPFQTRGTLRTATYTASAVIADEHYLAIERLINDHETSVLLIDPISALDKAGGHDVADLVCERLVGLVKARGLTAVFISVSTTDNSGTENTDTKISTIADTWLHLSYMIQRGERNRTLTVVKSRGTGGTRTSCASSCSGAKESHSRTSIWRKVTSCSARLASSANSRTRRLSRRAGKRSRRSCVSWKR